jgi:outer membrane protein
MVFRCISIAAASAVLGAPLAMAQPPTPQPSIAQPTTAQPATGQPTTGQPTTGQPTTGQPTTGQPTTINEALGSAYSTTPSLLAERAKLRATDEDVPQALSGWRPQVSFTADGGDQTTSAKSNGALAGSPKSVSKSTTTGLYSTTFSVTQPIYSGGHTKAQTARAESLVRAERATLIATEEQVLLNGVNAFVGVIQAEQLLQLNISNVQVLTRQLQATYDRYRVGELTRTDVAQAEAALAAGQAQVQTAAGTLATSRATYLQAIGKPPGKLIEPQPLVTPAKTRQTAIALASGNNPNVIAALYNDVAAKDAVNVAWSALQPQVSLLAQQLQNNNSVTTGVYSRQYQVLAELKVPIYQGGAEYATVRQARQTEQQQRKLVDDARRTAEQQTAQSWDTLIADRASAESTRVRIRADEIALLGVEQEAIVGSRTTQDVLNAQQELLTAQTTLVQNLASLVSASYSLAATVGRLTAKDLKLDVPLYVETAYYNDVRDAWIGTGDAAVSQPGR